MDLKFSVLIPVYYKENPEFFSNCLQSMYYQTLPPNQIVIIKDGQLTEKLDNILNYWKARFNNLSIISIEKNIGMSLALNVGLENCQYDWIARMDSDDIAMENRFEQQINYIKSNPDIDVLGSWIEEYDDDMKSLIAVRKVPATDVEIKKYAKYRNPINHMSVMYRRKCALEVGGYPSGFSTADDYAFWVHMIKKRFKFGNIQESLIRARTGKGFLERRQGVEYLKYELKFLKHLYDIKFYNKTQYLINLITRSTARLLPKKLLYFLYLILRKSNENKI